jgi:cbb3-type cytochrome oxidase subunit 3
MKKIIVILFAAGLFFLPDAVLAGPCTDSSQCNSTQYCFFGTGQCEPQKRDASGCLTADECFTGLCQSNYCVPQCTETSCSNTQYCNGKLCVNKKPVGSLCGGPTQCLESTCSPGGECVAGEFTFQGGDCDADDQCATDEYCSGTRCVRKRANGDGCDSEKQCVSGFCDATNPTSKICSVKSGTIGTTGAARATIVSSLARIDTLFPKEMQKNPDLQKVVGWMIDGVLGIIGTLALVIFLYSGIMWMTAQGKKETVDDAKHTMIYAAIGLFIVFGSYMFVSFIIKSISF